MGTRPSKEKVVDINKFKANNSIDNSYTPSQKKMLDKAREAGEVILVNGKEPMTEERWQAEQMRDVHKFLASDRSINVAHQL